MSIETDTLTAYGTYNFKLEACSYTNECSWAEISLLAAQSTTMCEVGIESHVEFEMVSLINHLLFTFHSFCLFILSLDVCQY